MPGGLSVMTSNVSVVVVAVVVEVVAVVVVVDSLVTLQIHFNGDLSSHSRQIFLGRRIGDFMLFNPT